MKLKKVFAVLLAGTAVLFASCTKDQSSYTMESLEGSTILTGVVKYDPGYQELSNGSSVLENYYVAAEGVTVKISVPYSSLGISGSGSKLYTVTTDANGAYTLELPMSINKTSISGVTIDVESFYKTYNLYKQDVQETSFTVVALENTLYKANSTVSTTLKRQDITKVDDILCDADYDEEVAYIGVTTVKGNVTYMPGYRIDRVTERPEKRDEVVAQGAKITATLKVAGETKNYTVLTDNNGDYEFELPVRITDMEVSATITVDTYYAPYFGYKLVQGTYIIEEEPIHAYSATPSSTVSVSLMRNGEDVVDFYLQ